MLDHPKITVSKPADSSDKVDVVNQNPTNFNTTTKQSMTKFEQDGSNAKNAEKHANTIPESATYISSRSSKSGKALVRDSDFAWLDPDEIHRSARNVMRFAARDDPDVTAHYRRYTSPRYCYRLPPRTRHPFLESRALNRNISAVSTRGIADFAPRNSKPPVREPNASDKREKKDEERKDEERKKEKKPVIRTLGESVDSSEKRAEMVAEDNPKGDPDAFRYEWGVKLAEEPVADNDNLAEKSRRYVTKRFWGVNLKQPDVEDPTSAEVPGRNAEEHRNASSSPIARSGDTIADETPRSNVSAKDASSLKGTTAEYLLTPSANLVSSSGGDSITPRQEKTDASDSSLSSEALRRIMKTSNVLEETIDNEYNVPEEATLDAEITAWKNVAMRSTAATGKEIYMSDNVENMEMVSIRPEAPQPKLDVRVVRSTEDTLEEVEHANAGYKDVKSMQIKHFESLQKPDGYVSSKRLHTASMQLRYPHRHISSSATLSINSALIDKTTQMKCSKLTSAFSTDTESSKEVIIKALNQQSEERIDSKSWNKEGKSNDTKTNNSSSIKRSLSPSLESRIFSSNNQKAPDIDKNVIANKEMKISLNQSQTAKHKKIRLPVSSESAQKSESHFKNEDELEDYENSNASYINLRDKDVVDFDSPSTDNGSMKSSNAKLTEEDSKSNEESDKNTTSDSNVENVEAEYIVDGDYVRLPGDPYPYTRENLDKWRALHFRNSIRRPMKRETKFDSVSVSRTSSGNANDKSYVNARDSHGGVVMKTSGSGDGAGAKNAERSANGFRVSPRSQRVVSDCLSGDAADAMGLRRWTEAFSRLDVDGDDASSSRAYHQ